jgi:hypothetical protein
MVRQDAFHEKGEHQIAFVGALIPPKAIFIFYPQRASDGTPP